ncbi:hypothetical protein OG874_17205 [Nocardia sp. NBC_00565]|uniref:hypothetical protein n=1 Tax=Nocardia sp. NBC_00565 TaxID=2975993 RepID=UPI002E80B78B|nr:hypothetical protein [Nocardia sp. NBC_00565]WUC06749.1 hypothetical protein OG874_17205 [Nocardia sp. NBC_00565]
MRGDQPGQRAARGGRVHQVDAGIAVERSQLARMRVAHIVQNQQIPKMSPSVLPVNSTV